ncbi:hypothetical protein KBD18_01660, partial [Patescibacteria group bacterium]|nr:hypothetical protein [Patescibacteria group bacterium]
ANIAMLGAPIQVFRDRAEMEAATRKQAAAAPSSVGDLARAALEASDTKLLATRALAKSLSAADHERNLVAFLTAQPLLPFPAEDAEKLAHDASFMEEPGIWADLVGHAETQSKRGTDSDRKIAILAKNALAFFAAERASIAAAAASADDEDEEVSFEGTDGNGAGASAAPMTTH